MCIYQDKCKKENQTTSLCNEGNYNLFSIMVVKTSYVKRFVGII